MPRLEFPPSIAAGKLDPACTGSNILTIFTSDLLALHFNMALYLQVLGSIQITPPMAGFSRLK